MLLDDPRLSFASDLIAHWTEIRGSGLVPFDLQIKPAKMIRAVPFITIANLSDLENTKIELAELALSRRYGRDIMGASLFEFIAPRYRKLVKQATRLFLKVPCGIYYKLSVASDEQGIIGEGETLSLPLRSIGSESPDKSISLPRDISFKGVADPDVSAVRQAVPGLWYFVDIGAGVPDELPIAIDAA